MSFFQSSAGQKLLASLATLGPVGRLLPAPGTWGSLLGVVFYYYAFQKTGLNTPDTFLQFFIFSALLVACAIPICEAGEKILGKSDPGEVNFDEFAVMPVCFAGLGNVIDCGNAGTLAWLGAGFALFRLFDIFKPWKIKDLQKLKGGFGVVADDFAAALATCACFWLAHGFISIFN